MHTMIGQFKIIIIAHNNSSIKHADYTSHNALSNSFSSPKTAILLDSTKNRGLWLVPIFEHAQSTCSVVFNQTDLSDLPEVLILGADQKNHGL